MQAICDWCHELTTLDECTELYIEKDGNAEYLTLHNRHPDDCIIAYLRMREAQEVFAAQK